MALATSTAPVAPIRYKYLNPRVPPTETPEDMQAVPPIPCSFKPGDPVIYTNDYGVEFELTVRGFAPDLFHGRFVYLDSDCWWMPKAPESLRIDEERVGK